ncbi:aminoglycoside phosphotransferase [Kribbella flavida DSM 17836]|uniref:Aminoglycoside phosphotransferase n=1 Tax=Kribbella flavida (strain DSM 17836 / JCM 10339 / NBRC 14399) TaxID=479435 RepID=D2PWX2_KRIFD|nr:phosphotransferase [Kribbella flavida]ADB35352.1 aminoglycoside phosphotransferase [Kribbella flavida DSM 17836]
MVRPLRSLPHPEALRDHLAEVYGLPFTGCTLLRSLVNDVYRVTAPAGSFVLKLYAADGRQLPEILWETGLSDQLTTAGIGVPVVQPLADGTMAGVLDAPEGDRPYVLTSFVDGTKPQPPFTDDLYRAFGELLARFHDATDGFTSPHPRRPAELAHRLDEPLAAILPLVDAPDAELLRELADGVRENVADGLSWGMCHGDVSLDNVLLTGDGLTLHDFDLSAEGYRASDFTGVATTPHWEAFRRGYTTVRPIPAADLAAVDWLMVVGSIVNLRFHLVAKPMFRGTESRTEGWADAELNHLRTAARHLLL